MRVRDVSATDGEPWDDFVRSHPQGSPYHVLAWRDAVRHAYGHEPRYLVLEDGGGRLRGVLPLFRFSVPLAGARYVSLPFCDLGGPLAEDAAGAAALVDAARERAAAEGAAPLLLRLADPGARPAGAHPLDTDKVRMLLRLPGSSEELLASFKSKLRSQVRKAAKNGMIFGWEEGPAALDDFYELFSLNMRDLGSPVHGRAWFEAVLAAYGDGARLGIVRHEGLAVAGGVVLAPGRRRMTIPWASARRSHNRLAPNMWLYWSVLAAAADEGYATFDFGRSTAGEGTYRFKEQWGALPEPLGWCAVAPGAADDGAPAGAAPDGDGEVESDGGGGARALAESLWRRLPLPVANRLGPALRKYIDR